ncbi:MAG: ATP-binding protein [Candidatus Hinthialibacter sp.]
MQYAGEGEIQANQIAWELGVSLDDPSSILTKAIHQRRALVVKNGTAEVAFDPIILKQLGNDHFAVVPLLVENNPIGVLVVDNIITKRPIEEDDIQLLEILAAQAALAIAHADAMEELARKVKETEAAYAELRASQEKLIEASKFAALGQMAATVAHEIRTPLVAIGGFVNLLMKKRTPGDSEYPHLKVVRDEALRLEDVLNRLLYYARPSQPQFEVQLIEPLIKNALALLETEFNERGIDVITEFAFQQPFPFDRNQIRQVIVNIIQNSFQSMEKGGKLYISTREENGEIIIIVRDTGEGISPENLSRIFEPFFSTKHAGTGLGMHVSQRIIQSHGGSIQVKSQLNQGAEVTIRLPRERTGETG